MGASNYVTGIINFCTLVLSIPIIGAGIWLASKGDTECVRFLQWPVIAIGVFILVVSIAGFIGGCCRVAWLLWFYLFAMFLLILLLLIFTALAFVVTNRGAGHALSNRGYKDYRLGDYSTWLQRYVEKPRNWRRIGSCLRDSRVCNDLDGDYNTRDRFYAANLSPIQSGCCKPPTDCNFQFQNATTWLPSPTTAPANATERDCTTWSNDRSQLCYNCDSCKAGLIQNIKSKYKSVAIVNAVVLVLLVVVYSIGCCAFRNARRQGNYGHGGYYYGKA
ncbi:hypothetical protein SELMODRAFT_162119 [Selaginella moellendorffii]|uniref:Tetraspanin family protein n=1 Tax=Selaginella moellendorffii TaxID=88036 RepID=D8T8Y6_SELML|nr:tetraspanin-8 [Selaginella moellendorffii]EFJ06915.1 hypothetical protein SELMODRAFT_162119 [Selaginella moellendorffii]|eukprot:XP_002992066.1 tetraspanin-8 [Selaginella moellendorffii]